jgi:hypothetical protein
MIGHNHSIQRMEASRLAQSACVAQWRLPSAADAARCRKSDRKY